METNTSTQYTIDGKSYTSVDQMPPDVRAKFEEIERSLADNNHNGMPDIAEGSDSDVAVIQQNSVSIKSIPLDAALAATMRQPSSKGQPYAKHRYKATASGRADDEVQMSKSTLIALLIAVAIMAAGVVWLLKI